MTTSKYPKVNLEAKHRKGLHEGDRSSLKTVEHYMHPFTPYAKHRGIYRNEVVMRYTSPTRKRDTSEST